MEGNVVELAWTPSNQSRRATTSGSLIVEPEAPTCLGDVGERSSGITGQLRGALHELRVRGLIGTVVGPVPRVVVAEPDAQVSPVRDRGGREVPYRAPVALYEPLVLHAREDGGEDLGGHLDAARHRRQPARMVLREEALQHERNVEPTGVEVRGDMTDVAGLVHAEVRAEAVCAAELGELLEERVRKPLHAVGGEE